MRGHAVTCAFDRGRGLAKGLFLSLLAVLTAAGLSLAPGAGPAAADGVSEGTGKTVGEYALVYRTFQRDMDDFTKRQFTDVREVRKAHKLLATYDPKALTRGWFAHHALVAADSPAFFEAVHKAARDEGKERFLTRITATPGALRRLTGGGQAEAMVLAEIHGDTARMRILGDLMLDRARTMMDARVKKRRAFRGPQDTAATLIGTEPKLPRAEHVPYEARPLVDRMLVLAARISLGETETVGGAEAADSLINHKITNRCVRWAKLNLAQCIAAARFPEEEAYCTGRHGVNEVASCWSWMTGEDKRS